MERRAFTLLETLIALAILGIALVSMVGWLARSANFERRLDLHRLAIRELDAQHEALRAGGPLPGLNGDYLVSPLTELAGLEAPQVRMTVSPQSKVGLFAVTIEARYRIAGQRFERKLDSLTWRPL